MKKSKKINFFKMVLMGMVIVLFIGIILYLFPVIKDLSTVEGQVAFKQRVNESGFLGMLMLFGLQVAQVFLIVLPGEPIEILAGMCYGTIGGYIFITVSVAIITTVIFYLVRTYGRKFVYEFCNKEKIDKIEKSKIFKNPKKIEYIMIILFIIPGTPKDLLLYIAGLLPIKPLRFILISTFVRFPSVISSTIAGEHLSLGNWKMSILIYAITFIAVGIFVFVANKLDKNKTAKEAIKAVKS